MPAISKVDITLRYVFWSADRYGVGLCLIDSHVLLQFGCRPHHTCWGWNDDLLRVALCANDSHISCIAKVTITLHYVFGGADQPGVGIFFEDSHVPGNSDAGDGIT